MRNPFDFFDSPMYNSFANDLCTDGWPHGVVILNIAINDCKKAYEKLEQENEKLKSDLEVAKESLTFYSNGRHIWSESECATTCKPIGFYAKEALARLEGE